MLKHFELSKHMTVNSDVKTVAINPNHVIAVFETMMPVRVSDEVVKEGEQPEVEKVKATVVIIPEGQKFHLEDSYLDVVARLNEQ